MHVFMYVWLLGAQIYTCMRTYMRADCVFVDELARAGVCLSEFVRARVFVCVYYVRASSRVCVRVFVRCA